MNTNWSALILDDDPGLRQSVRLCLEADNVRVLGVGTTAGCSKHWSAAGSMLSFSISG